MRSAFLVLLTATALTLTACNRGGTVPEDGGAVDANGANNGGFATDQQGGGGGNITETPLEAEQRRLMQQLVVYFEYDEAEILPEFNALLQAHGQFLARNPNSQLRLEGHADERGSREYNIGLGERRAQSVRRVLMLQGAASAQFTTVSYGEERPAQTGSDDEAWRLNRRVELVYR